MWCGGREWLCETEYSKTADASDESRCALVEERGFVQQSLKKYRKIVF